MESLNKMCMQQVVNQHGGLVFMVAQKLAKVYEQEEEDVIQIGYMGLMKAAKGYDPERGVEFSTYAVAVITGEIKSQLRDQGPIKVSRSLKADGIKIKKAENEYIKKHGTSPHINKLAELTGFTREHLLEVIQAGEALANMKELEDDSAWTSTEDENVDRIDLNNAISQLNDDEKKLICLRYFKDFTQQQTARAMMISQVKVCRMEKKILQKIGETLQKKE